MGLEQCRIIDLPKITDPKGDLTFIEGNHHIPFEIKRVFYVYHVPTDVSRGGHANKLLQKFFICLSGSFTIDLDDGLAQKSFQMQRPWQGLFVPPMIWTGIRSYAPGSVCLVLASRNYEVDDYYRDYYQFREIVKNNRI